jgi:segregation and condensation protein A
MSLPQTFTEAMTTSDLPLEIPAIAKLYGHPLTQIPKDLFIPPDALEIILDAFEGPLDLLLYLIRKQNLNILDIPMAQLTSQYLVYVEEIRRNHFELAGEYLLMAAMLIEIKSRMLLPKPKKATEDETEEDPRAELARRLIEYERMKLAGQLLDALPLKERDFFVCETDWQTNWKSPLPKVALIDLHAAMNAVLKRASLNRQYHITREELSVRVHMSQILKRLQTLDAQTYLTFEALFEDQKNIPHVVVHFLALLELLRENLIYLSQDAPYQTIYIAKPQAQGELV